MLNEGRKGQRTELRGHRKSRVEFIAKKHLLKGLEEVIQSEDLIYKYRDPWDSTNIKNFLQIEK